MSSLRRELGPILVESLGIFVVAFFGADLLYAQEVPGVGVPTLLLTSLAIAIGFLVYRVDEALAADRGQEDEGGTTGAPRARPRRRAMRRAKAPTLRPFRRP